MELFDVGLLESAPSKDAPAPGDIDNSDMETADDPAMHEDGAEVPSAHHLLWREGWIEVVVAGGCGGSGITEEPSRDGREGGRRATD